jgi:hypothetical protein
MFGHDNHDTTQQSNDAAQSAPLPPAPVADGTLASDPLTTPAVTSGFPEPEIDVVHPGSSSTPIPSNDVASPVDPHLLDIKQQALRQLTPLVGHLEQTPEEKFRTTMMMIQGADNQELIKDAYAAAQQISDEKARAQALLDVVNEINYFTQHANA